MSAEATTTAKAVGTAASTPFVFEIGSAKDRQQSVESILS